MEKKLLTWYQRIIVLGNRDFYHKVGGFNFYSEAIDTMEELYETDVCGN